MHLINEKKERINEGRTKQVSYFSEKWGTQVKQGDSGCCTGRSGVFCPGRAAGAPVPPSPSTPPPPHLAGLQLGGSLQAGHLGWTLDLTPPSPRLPGPQFCICEGVATVRLCRGGSASVHSRETLFSSQASTSSSGSQGALCWCLPEGGGREGGLGGRLCDPE